VFIGGVSVFVEECDRRREMATDLGGVVLAERAELVAELPVKVRAADALGQLGVAGALLARLTRPSVSRLHRVFSRRRSA
jgi:hypothetical protein